MVESDRESILGMNALVFGTAIVAMGFIVYFATSKLRAKYAAQVTPEDQELA
jgi:hypothetical protein